MLIIYGELITLLLLVLEKYPHLLGIKNVFLLINLSLKTCYISLHIHD